MSSRFRNLGPRDRRTSSQWPDFLQVSGHSLRTGSANCREASKEGEEEKGILDRVWQGSVTFPVFLLRQKVSAKYRTYTEGSVGRK